MATRRQTLTNRSNGESWTTVVVTVAGASPTVFESLELLKGAAMVKRIRGD